MKKIIQAKRKAIARSFMDKHSFKWDFWIGDLNEIYWNLIGGVYGEVEKCDMGEGVTNYTIEIHHSESKTCSTTIFDIDIDDDLISDIEG